MICVSRGKASHLTIVFEAEGDAMQRCSQRQLQQADTFPFLVASVKSGSARVTRSLQPAPVARRVMMMGGNWAGR